MTESQLRDAFLLDPSVVFLNHGSFGACPREVFVRYQAWQRELERQPVAFMSRRYEALMREARATLATYVGADRDDLVYVPNATTGVNIVARSLALGPDDEVLTTDHEYGACDRTWRFLAGKRGFDYRKVSIPVPVTTHEALVERIWSAVTPRTRVLFLSHITSLTALTLPVAELCARARAAGVLTVIDGAHAPGQVPLDMKAVGADFYTGNCHKWLCAPKGAAFLYARREVQDRLEPLVVSWGWQSERPGPSRFVDEQEFGGTRDIAAYLTVPAAIAWQAAHDWPDVRARCHALLRWARTGLTSLPGVSPLCPDDAAWYAQMASFEIPTDDPAALQARLYDAHRIEVVVKPWSGRALLRVSAQAYNTHEDIITLVKALDAELAPA